MTLIEVLIAAAVFIVISFTLFEIVRHLAFSTQRLSTQQHQRADISHLLDQLESDQQSADAVFIPATDVFRSSNANAHEVDFFAKDGANRPYYWAYYFDAAAHAVARYNYPSPGATPIQSGSPIENVQSLTLSEHQISEVSDPSSPIYLPIFTSAANYSVPVGAGASAQGGTQVIHLELATKTERIPIDLGAASAPSGFTVVLNYTPRPSPTPGALTTWPNAIAFATSGNSLTYNRPADRKFDMAAVVNRLLGGGVADAATGTCSAIAYKDTDAPPWSIVDANNPGADGISTDAQGCLSFNGNQALAGVVVSQSNYSGAFAPASYTCSGYVNFGSWNPVAGNGPQAGLSTSGVTPINECTFTISGGGSQTLTPGQGLVNAQVVPAGSCPNVGEVCVLSFAWPASGGDGCDPATGAVSGGYTGANMSFSGAAGLGTIYNDGSGGGTFTRTATAPASITAREGYQTWIATLRKSGGYSCSAISSIRNVGTFTIN